MAHILIVDDEVENRRSLRRYLQDYEERWEIHEAADVEGAQKVLDSAPVDVVITDLVMGSDVSGMVVLQAAKQRDPLTMVILITAYERKLDRYSAFGLGAFDCVQKNTPGIVAAEEILVKAKAALQFRHLAQERLENQRQLTFLSRYFDPRVWRTIQKDPALLELQSRTLSISFWDIRGFSRVCESLKAHPTLISGFLREYFDIAAEVVFRNSGVLDKFIGDGVMALFGALNGEDDGTAGARDAVQAALEMVECFNGLSGKWLENWALYTPQEVEIGLGCGVHTGEVLVGNVGADSREQYTALGPDVNFAQRLESKAGKAEVLLSVSCAARVKHIYSLEGAGSISGVKNIPGTFPLFSVRGALT